MAVKTAEQLAFGQEVTELLEQMNERQLRKAARFIQLYIGQGMSYEDAAATAEAEFPKE